jgi:molybdopterin molybdotransferase
MRASAYPLVEVEDASALVREHTQVLGVERVALADCAGRVLAEDVTAPAPLPAFPSSAVDGYAVRSADAGKALRVLGESAAGRPFAGTVEKGTAARILTGGVLPEGADCVVMVEDVHFAGDLVVVPGDLRQGSNFHRPGDDIRAGELALPRGIQLGAAELGLCAAGCRSTAGRGSH